MISVNVDMSAATEREREEFYSLPHIAGAIDTLVYSRYIGTNIKLDIRDSRADMGTVTGVKLPANPGLTG